MASGWQAGGTVRRNNGRNTGADVWAVDAAAAQPIDAAGHDTHDETLADSIEECLHIGGYNAMTADLDVNGNDILSAVNVQASGDIVFSERADHASTPAAGKGYLWVRNDSPSSLIFTADDATDYDLTNITSVGTLTELQVDNLNLNGNTISTTAGTDLNITPLAGQQIVLDGTIVIDAGVVTGATSITSTAFVGDLTGTVQTAAQPNITSLGTLTTLTVDNLILNGNSIQSNPGNLELTPKDGSAIVLDGTINVDAGVVTGATSITSTAFVGTLSTAAQPNITSLGTLTTLTVDNITVNGAAITSDTGAISFDNENLYTTGDIAIGSASMIDTEKLLVSLGSSGIDGTDVLAVHAVVIERNADVALLIASPNTDNCRIDFGDSDSSVAGQISFSHSADAFNFLVGGVVQLQLDATDADFQDNNITTTGTVTAGTLKTGTHSAIGAETVTGYITIKDAGGTDRKIAVVS